MGLTLRIIKSCLFLSLILLLGGSFWLTEEVSRPLRITPENNSLEIENGLNVRQIGDFLVAKKLVRSSFPFLVSYHIFADRRALQAGEYLLANDESIKSLLVKLIKGQVRLHAIVIREGMTAAEVAELLSFLGNPQEFLRAIEDPTLIADLDSQARDLEGYLFPETYYFPKKIPAAQALKTIISQFRQVFEPAWQKRGAQLGLSVREAVILASLIEKETSLPAERPLVSAVFHNRLRLGMKLDCDPTVIYALKKNGLTIEKLKQADLMFPSPYNTYLHAGLPPGPICNPGREALKAALFPAPVNFLYFVSRGDGSHYFSSSYQEHLRAVARYQKANLKKNKPAK